MITLLNNLNNSLIITLIFQQLTVDQDVISAASHITPPSLYLLPLRPRNIQWSKINDTLPERAEISGPTFQISRLSQSHNGTYLCQAQNNFGRAADHYTLLVYGE